jgi:hypothetical protein
MAKAGRKAWTPPYMKLVEKLASQGLKEKEIALALGICRTTLYNKKNQLVEFMNALEAGKAKGCVVVTSKLMEQVSAGSMEAIKTYLKCVMGWKETSVMELPPRKPLEEMSDDELRAILENRKI